MIVRPLNEWKGRHQGEDVFVIAAGPSMQWLPPSMFEGRIVVGVNDVYRHYPTTYCVRKENQGAQQCLDAGQTLIKGRADGGGKPWPLQADGDWWEFDHAQGVDGDTPDLSRIGSDDSLVVTWSTTPSAIHFAAYLGAAVIFVCGHDLDMIDGQTRYPGYYEPGSYFELTDDEGSHDGWYAWWLQQIGWQTCLVRDRLQEVYGCRIVSLSPWIGHQLEGHVLG